MINSIRDSSTRRTPRVGHRRTAFLRLLLARTLLLLGSASVAFGQTDPWSTVAGRLATVFTGPVAKSLALVAIVLGGLQMAFSEGGGRRAIGGLLFGLGMALGASSFLAWLFT